MRSTWTGWKVVRRPLVESFNRYCSQSYGANRGERYTRARRETDTNPPPQHVCARSCPSLYIRRLMRLIVRTSPFDYHTKLRRSYPMTARARAGQPMDISHEIRRYVKSVRARVRLFREISFTDHSAGYASKTCRNTTRRSRYGDEGKNNGIISFFLRGKITVYGLVKVYTRFSKPTREKENHEIRRFFFNIQHGHLRTPTMVFTFVHIRISGRALSRSLTLQNRAVVCIMRDYDFLTRSTGPARITYTRA